MTAARIPVTVLTGFLGSGKTTVLNRLLRQPALDGTVAIINEFGAVGLDHLLAESSEESFALLDNGCICCTVRDDLVATLKQVHARSRDGALPPVRRILVETTGLADPVPILHTLAVEPALTALFAIDGVVATVDAVNGLATLAAHAEATKQVAVADRLLITKTDLADPAAFAALEARLAQLSPTAGRLQVRHGAVAADQVLGCGLEAAGQGAGLAGWFEAASLAADRAAAQRRAPACDDPACGHDHHDDHHHHHHDAGPHHGISAHAFVIDEALQWDAFAQWLDYVTALKGEDLLRMKGLLHMADEPDRPLVVHAVQHVVHPPVRLDAWPDAERRSRLVFIVRDIDREVIERTLARFASIDTGRMARPASALRVA